MAGVVVLGLPMFVQPSGAAPERSTRRGGSGQPAATGPLQIMVSLSQQRLTVFDGGVQVATSAISSGQPGYETPAGVYSILQKNRYHESNIYSGAPMPFMQRITWSGIALHEGHLPGHAASHGCIRLPGAFAGTLFGMTRIGARVIVSREPLSPRPIEHPTLFQPHAPAATGPLAGEVSAGGFVISSAAAAVLSPPPERSAATTDEQGHVSVLISRQTGRLYIRRNFEPVYEGPVVIKDAELPLGTHVFTAVGRDGATGRLAWNVVTVSASEGLLEGTRAERAASARADAAAGIRRTWETSPAAALERIELEPDLAEELAEVARPGMSLLITDRGLGPETGKGTEFVIQTR